MTSRESHSGRKNKRAGTVDPARDGVPVIIMHPLSLLVTNILQPR
jgi:hypothetical protein